MTEVIVPDAPPPNPPSYLATRFVNHKMITLILINFGYYFVSLFRY